MCSHSSSASIGLVLRRHFYGKKTSNSNTFGEDSLLVLPLSSQQKLRSIESFVNNHHTSKITDHTPLQAKHESLDKRGLDTRLHYRNRYLARGVRLTIILKAICLIGQGEERCVPLAKAKVCLTQLDCVHNGAEG